MNIGNFTAEIISKAGALHDALDRIGKSPKGVTKPLVEQLIRGGFPTSRVVPGRMYTFRYEAKGKDVLPFWDAHPVVLVLERFEDGGFNGLNFHYLPLDLRIKCFYLLDHQTRPQDRKTLTVTWEKLKASAARRMAEVTIKRYLPNHIKSRLTQIPAKDWYLALALPMADFIKSTEKRVTAISRNYVGAG